ncbi:hypothetical protein P8452_59906 [Trifolium repens]|nr:hypothetical protein P8452_59906 [Trifolium repens]
MNQRERDVSIAVVSVLKEIFELRKLFGADEDCSKQQNIVQSKEASFYDCSRASYELYRKLNISIKYQLFLKKLQEGNTGF